MASAEVEFELDLPATEAWELIGDFGSPSRIAPGFVRECVVEGDERLVTFESGAIVRERLITRDPARRRLVYSVVGGRFEHHNAVMKVLALGCSRAAVQWTADMAPDELGSMVQSMMQEGAQAIVAEQKRRAEAQGRVARPSWFAA
jgi:hypothetical protein